jgi:bla regulator protein blaR1
MGNFFYSFYQSVFHSLWQATLLFAIYWLCIFFFQNSITSIKKRNLLLAGLAIQMVLLIATFFLCFFTTLPINENLFFNTNQFIHPIFYTKNIAPVVFYIYVVVLTFKIIKEYSGWYILKKQILNNSIKPSIDLRLFTKQTALRLGIKTNVQIWLSNTIKVPITFGYLKPIVIFPISLLSNLSCTQVEALLIHELAHIKAKDYLLNWFLLFNENLFFFNPAIVIMCKQAKLEREKNCDNVVINFNYSPLLFAQALLQAENNKQHLLKFPLAAVTQKNQLLLRIQHFCGVNKQSFSPPKNMPTLLLIAVLMVSISFFNNLFLKTNVITKNSTSDLSILVEKNKDKKAELNLFDAEKKIFSPAKKRNLVKQKSNGSKPTKKAETNTINNEIENILIDDDFTMPAAVLQNDATKQVIIQEEQSGSRTATVKVYEVKFVNGEWIIQPKLKATAKEIKGRVTQKIKTKKPHRNAANVKNLSAL